MVGPAHLAVVSRLCAAPGSDANWVVAGSLGLALQGVPTEVNDIDVQTDRRGAYEIERRFSKHVVEGVAFSSAERVRSHLGALLMDGIRVEIMGDIEKRLEGGTWEAPVDFPRHRTSVRLGALEVPVLALEYEREAYRKLGRAETAELIERWPNTGLDTPQHGDLQGPGP